MEDVVKSVGRVFAVLEAFARVQSAMTATEIARRLDYPASSTAALLKSMVTLGYLSFDRMSRAYEPTVLLGMLARWTGGSTLSSAAIQELVDELHAETGEMVIIAIQNDLSMRYLLTRPGRFPVRFLAPAGIVRPLCASGTGWACLSAKSSDEVAALVGRVNRTAAPGQAVDLVQLQDLLQHVRDTGYAASYGSVIAGSGVIAMPLPGADHALVLGIGGPVERLQRNEAAIAGKMQRALDRVFAAAAPDAAETPGR